MNKWQKIGFIVILIGLYALLAVFGFNLMFPKHIFVDGFPIDNTLYSWRWLFCVSLLLVFIGICFMVFSKKTTTDTMNLGEQKQELESMASETPLIRPSETESSELPALSRTHEEILKSVPKKFIFRKEYKWNSEGRNSKSESRSSE